MRHALVIALISATTPLLACDFCGGSAAIRTTAVGGPWTSGASWVGGVAPQAGQPVVIESTATVTLDAATPALASLKVGGVLRVVPGSNASITSAWIMVAGAGARLEAGTEAAPLASRFTITLTGTDRTANVTGIAPMTTGSKFLIAMDGGTIDLHGASRDNRSWTVLDGNLAAGATALTVADTPTGWAVGDKLCLAPTGFDATESEAVTITAISGRTVSFTPALQYPHWGTLQTIEGTVVDQRAEVGVLTRNIVIQGDAASDAAGYGAHGMIMAGGRGYLEGVQFLRCGQRGLKGRYAWHWHLLDRAPYAQAGVTGAGQYIRDCSFDSSFQRAVNIHGTDGVLVEDNVAYNTQNHAFVFAEDGDEDDNILRGNLVVHVRLPAGNQHAFPVLSPDHPGIVFSEQNEDESSGFWGLNPHQYISNNHIAGVQEGSGIAYDHDISTPYAEAARTLRRRIEVTGNSMRAIAGEHGFDAHMYGDFAGFGIMTLKPTYSSEIGFFHIHGNQMSKCMAAASWLDSDEYFADNVISDCNAASHALHASFVRNTVIGYTANTRGRNGQADGPALRPAVGMEQSFVNNHWQSQVIVGNRFIGLNQPGLYVNDTMQWGTGAYAAENIFINHTGPRYDRFKVNLNAAYGHLLDRDGTLTGQSAPTLITMDAINGSSVYRSALHSHTTALNAAPGYFRVWFENLRDGDTVNPGQSLTLRVVHPPASSSWPWENSVRMSIGGITASAPFTASSTSLTLTVPTTVAPGFYKVTVGQYNSWDDYHIMTQRIFLRINGGNQPPTVALTTPSAAASLTAPATVALTANASDADGSVAHVAFYAGSTLIGTDTTAPYAATWSGVTAGTYALTARATDNSGATTTSAPVTITVTTPPPAGLPSPWAVRDVGTNGVPASAAYDAGTDRFTITGSGRDISGRSDGFAFVGQPMAGDLVLTARLVSFTAPRGWSKAGVMVRAGVATNDAHVASIMTRQRGVHHVARTAAGGATTMSGDPAPRGGRWLRVQRSGSLVTSSDSADGLTWRVLGSATLPLAATAQAGLAVTSRQNNTAATAVFEQVTLVPVGGG
jgi:regulation of enolase protein 1 (concanavalin A-like superfamily)